MESVIETYITKLDRIYEDVQEELLTALDNHPPFNSAHEGFAVLMEEFEELKVEVFMKEKFRDNEAMRNEAVQVAAMAMRFIIEVCDA